MFNKDNHKAQHLSQQTLRAWAGAGPSRQHLLESTGSSRWAGAGHEGTVPLQPGRARARRAAARGQPAVQRISLYPCSQHLWSLKLKNCIHIQAPQQKTDEVEQVQQRTVTTTRGWSRPQAGVSGSHLGQPQGQNLPKCFP